MSETNIEFTSATSFVLESAFALSRAVATRADDVVFDNVSESDLDGNEFFAKSLAREIPCRKAQETLEILRRVFVIEHTELIPRPVAARYPAEADELGIPIRVQELDLVTVAIAWHVSAESAARLAPRADALVSSMLAPTVDMFGRSRSEPGFSSFVVACPAQATMVDVMRKAWETAPFCFAGQHVVNSLLVITDGHEDLSAPSDDLAVLLRDFAANEINVIILDISGGGGSAAAAAAASFHRMESLYRGWGQTCALTVDHATCGDAATAFGGYSFLDHSRLWTKKIVCHFPSAAGAGGDCEADE
jgi:hypothetical protein